MADPIIPILKKVAVAIVSDNKGRKVVIGIVLGIIFVSTMPIIAIMGIFSGGIDLGLDDINSLIEQQQAVGESTLTAICRRTRKARPKSAGACAQRVAFLLPRARSSSFALQRA